jgi:hypothetical protein
MCFHQKVSSIWNTLEVMTRRRVSTINWEENLRGAFGFVSDGLVESVELGAGGVVDAGGLCLHYLLIDFC